MQKVLTVNATIMAKIKETYPVINKPLANGIAFRAKSKGVTITAYTSKKVLFQGKSAATEAAHWENQLQDQQCYAEQLKQLGKKLPDNFAKWSVLGSDEVGAGSYFGPLTTAAVFVTNKQIPILKIWGIMDSKKLSDSRIIKLAEQILAICQASWLNLSPLAYNQRMINYSQAQLKALCHNYVLGQTLDKIAPQKPQGILIDQFIKPQTYFKYLTGQPRIVKHQVYFQIHGEQAHIAVAAASIVARYQSLKVMNQLSKIAGTTLPIGANHKVDLVAAKLINDGKDLHKFAKYHFSNTTKARQIAVQSKNKREEKSTPPILN